MSVSEPDRTESKTEFDRVYFQIVEDAVKLTENSLGAKGEVREKHEGFIKVTSDRVMRVASDIGTHIRMANSIFPTSLIELKERRTQQGKAIGLCYDLLTKYQIAMKILKVPDDKFVQEIKNIAHEINCLKSWRTSDNQRFKYLG